jgi:hypothetical protein
LHPGQFNSLNSKKIDKNKRQWRLFLCLSVWLGFHDMSVAFWAWVSVSAAQARTSEHKPKKRST